MMLPVLAVALFATPYVDGSPTLGKIIQDSTHITVLRVDKVSAEKRIIVFRKEADLKGELAGETVSHQITDGWHPREGRFVMTWAQPGRRAIFFSNGSVSMTCIGDYWYQSSAREAPWWAMTVGKPELSYAYLGSAEKLHSRLSDILAGKEVIITAVKHEEGRWSTYSNVAFRDVMQGRENAVCRIKASLQMPHLTMNVSRDPRWVVGAGAAGAEDLPERIAALKDAEPRIRIEAAADLGSMGAAAAPAAQALRAALKDPVAAVRIGAAAALLRIDRSGLPSLVEELKSKDPSARRDAAQAMGRSGAEARGAVSALKQALGDSAPDVRWAAAEALGHLGPDAEPAVPALTGMLGDGAARAAAVDALGRIGPKARGAVPALVPLLKDEGSIGWAAALALGRIGGAGAKAAVPRIVPELKSSDEKARWDATIILWTIGPDAKDAAPALIDAIKSGNDMAVEALSSVDLKAAVPFLVSNRLKHGDAGLRRVGADQLGNAGKDAVSAIPALTEALNDPDEEVRKAAKAAIAKIRRK